MTIELERRDDGITRIRMSTWQGRTVGYDVSAFLIGDVLVDTGFPKVGAELMAFVRQKGVRGVIVTHSHEDHAGNAARLAEAGVPVVMHPAAERALRVNEPIGLYRRIVWGTPHALTVPLRTFDLSPLQVIEVAGHSPDHIAVWDEERRILASGDLFLGVKVRIAHVHERPRQLVETLRRVAGLEPRLLLDAHRGAIEEPVPLLRAKIAWMEETIGEIESLASRGASVTEIRQRVFGREEFTGYVSVGEYSRDAFVKTVLREVQHPLTGVPARLRSE